MSAPSSPLLPPQSSLDALLACIDRRRHILFAILAVMVLIAFSGQWRPGPDTSLYVSLGRNIAAGAGYQSTGWLRGNTHFGLPDLLAANFRLFGPQTFWPAITLMLLLGVTALALTYRFFLFHFPRPTAVLLTLLVGTSFVFTEYLYELLTDMPSYLGIIASLTAFEALVDQPRAAPASPPLPLSKRFVWSLLLIAGLLFSAIMRPVTFSLVLAMAAAAVWPSLRRVMSWRTIIAASGLIFVLIAAFAFLDPRHTLTTGSHEEWLHRVFIEHPGQTLHTIVGTTFPLVFGKITVEGFFSISVGAFLSNLAALILLAATFLACRRRLLWMLWFCGMIVMLLIYPEPQTRYYLPILPFMAMGFWKIAVAANNFAQRRRHPRLAQAAVAACLAAWLVPNLARLANLAYQQHAHPFLAHVINGRYIPFQEMDDKIIAHVPADAVILSDEALALEAFAPNRRFMMPIWSAPPPGLLAELPSLLKHGRLYIVETGDPQVDAILQRYHLTRGPVLAQSQRPAWDLPPVPGRWLHKRQLSLLPPLLLRQVFPPGS